MRIAVLWSDSPALRLSQEKQVSRGSLAELSRERSRSVPRRLMLVSNGRGQDSRKNRFVEPGVAF